MIDGTAIAEQVGDAPVIGDVDGNCDRIQPLGDGIEPLGVTRGDDDMRALLSGKFRGGKANAGRASDHHDLLACERHLVSPALL
jgi:hypothetical protein